MYIAYISPLKIKECISRLEEAKKKETVAFAREFSPPRCEVGGRTFTLRKNYAHFVPYMHCELSEVPEGTLISYSMKLDWATSRFNSLWLIGVIPIVSCLTFAFLIESLMNGFSRDSILGFLLIGSIPAFYFLLRKLGVRQSEHDKKEMLEFIQRVLDAKPKLP